MQVGLEQKSLNKRPTIKEINTKTENCYTYIFIGVSHS